MAREKAVRGYEFEYRFVRRVRESDKSCAHCECLCQSCMHCCMHAAHANSAKLMRVHAMDTHEMRRTQYTASAKFMNRPLS